MMRISARHCGQCNGKISTMQELAKLAFLTLSDGRLAAHKRSVEVVFRAYWHGRMLCLDRRFEKRRSPYGAPPKSRARGKSPLETLWRLAYKAHKNSSQSHILT